MKKSADIVSSWIRTIVGAFLVLSICFIVIFIIQILHAHHNDQVRVTTPSSAPTNVLKEIDTVRFPFAKIERIIDGDTVVVSTSDVPENISRVHNLDSQKITVRMIGINTPETVDPRRPVQCFGKEASKEAARLLQDKIVRIETDDSQDMVDKYNRLLAYIFILPKDIPANNYKNQNQNVDEDNQIDDNKNELFYNLYMIRQGYAYEYTYAYPYRYQKQFKEEERFAKDNKNGLWQLGVCDK